MTSEVPEALEGTWLWLQGCTRWIGTWCFFAGYRLRVHYRNRVPTSGSVVGEGDVDNAHHGAVWLARAGGVRLLPVMIRGTRRLPRSRRRFRPQVDVLVGEPIAVPPGCGRAASVDVTDDMRNRRVALIAELDQIRGLGVLRAMRPGTA